MQNPPTNHISDNARRLLKILGLMGPSTAKECCSQLAISQPSFSRLIRSLGDRILVAGKGKSTRYAVIRDLPGISTPVPVFELRPPGQNPKHLMDLIPVMPRGFFTNRHDAQPGMFYDDLPWFLGDMMPSGFLGRLMGKRYAEELGLPQDIRLWSCDQGLAFMTRFGSDLPGAFIVGDAAYLVYLNQAGGNSLAIVQIDERSQLYPRFVTNVLTSGPIGSSAAGEQPKFLAILHTVSPTDTDAQAYRPVLVKFSPVNDNPVAQRLSDLLVCEHIAHQVINEMGFPSVATELLQVGSQTFLQLDRFDRHGLRHRAGCVTLACLDAEFVGSDQSSWFAAAGRLHSRGVVPGSELPLIMKLELFSTLIGNTDRHFGNLAFLMDGTTVTGLAPPYDILPMRYYPHGGLLVNEPIAPPALRPSLAPAAHEVITCAVQFWHKVAEDERISAGFRSMAAENARRVDAIRHQLDLLPATI